ncbi:hypothetical protein BKA70DRAFT_1487912 [Coprinopsis sp. MPI-PUGE-AT-0042]|nr:hypothetical protein BKA70DRAFT_1487912 [Coprinopsis sp. MPI-PUGE-AT-0042]
MAKTNDSTDGFMKAAKAFGRFQDEFLFELYNEIRTHVGEEEDWRISSPLPGITVHDSDVLEPAPARPAPRVRAPAKLSRRRPGPLSWDMTELASEKSAAQAMEKANGPPAKRARLDDGDEPHFKVPSLPMRVTNQRQRGEETPSHPGGLSETARARLDSQEEPRKAARRVRPYKERLLEGLQAHNEPRKDAPRGLGDFQRRLNRDRDDWRRGGDRDNRRNNDAPSRKRQWMGWCSGQEMGRANARIARSGDEDEGAALNFDMQEWEDEQTKLDRDWYTGAEEGGVAGDDDHNPLAQYEDLAIAKQAEIAKKQTKKVSARQAQYNADNDLWEANRMLTSVWRRAKPSTSTLRTNQSLRSTSWSKSKAAFLGCKTVFTKQLDPINPIQGSALVKEKREQAERAKAAAKLAALAGDSAWKHHGGCRPKRAAADGKAGTKGQRRKEDYKGDSKFASHMKASTGVSTFAKTRTLKEQREYLPAFACREELLKVIRENQVVLVVGETVLERRPSSLSSCTRTGTAHRRSDRMYTTPVVSPPCLSPSVSAEEMECKLGGTVGYAIRFEDCTSSDTRIKCKVAYRVQGKAILTNFIDMTDGVLLRESAERG